MMKVHPHGSIPIAASLLSLVATLGCSDKVIDDDPIVDANAPKIVITKPERGVFLPDYQVAVEGRVSDPDFNLERVEVNGEIAILEDDGSFRLLVGVGDGTTLLRTVAFDTDGNEGKDTRSVMAGNLVPLDTPSADGIVGRIGRSTFETINTTMVNVLESPEEIKRLMSRFNPLVESGGECLGVSVDVDEVSIANAEVEILPIEEGLTFYVRLHNPSITMPTEFAVACIDGDTNIIATADLATIAGTISIRIDRGVLEVEVEGVNSTFENLQVDAGILSSQILETFLSDLDGLASDGLESLVESQLDSFIDGFLTSLVRGETTIGGGSGEITIGASPTIVDFNEEGAFIAADTFATVPNVPDHAGYIATPSDEPVIDAQDFNGFRGMVADDFVNQTFAAFWATGALSDRVIFDTDLDEEKSFLGQHIDRVEVNVLLPPYVDARGPGSVRLTVGDIIVNIIDERPEGDRVVTSLALSAALDVSVDVDGQNRLNLDTRSPDIWVDVLGEGEGVSGPNPFDRDEIEVLASFVVGSIAGAADDLVRNIPIPTIGGTTVEEAELSSDRGYVVVGGSLAIPE